ncbi:MAG: ubiquinol-cytochrome C chaperone family protein [Maricaulaceae bacterium]|jgi:cytochrome b pre-mRNA-processing protein 3
MFGLRKKDAPAQAAGARLLDAARDAARRPALYGPGRIPDTLDGRFESMVLHVALLHERLSGAGEEYPEERQAMFDQMFDEFDAALREIGVGDLSVSKKIRKMGEAFYGRLNAYRAALISGDDSALEDVLRRNALATAEPEPAFVSALARYVCESSAALASQPVEDLLNGAAPDWAPPPQ